MLTTSLLDIFLENWTVLIKKFGTGMSLEKAVFSMV
jgi:hypothetical protein